MIFQVNDITKNLGTANRLYWLVFDKTDRASFVVLMYKIKSQNYNFLLIY